MIERSGYVSYANCGLPYYVGGVIKGAGRTDAANSGELLGPLSH